MSGTFIVNEDHAWIPAGWVFDDVLTNIAAELEHEAPKLALQLLFARAEFDRALTERGHPKDGPLAVMPGGYCDLRAIDAATFGLILRAADRAYAKLLAEDENAFYDPSHRPSYIEKFRQLKEMLHSDARAQ